MIPASRAADMIRFVRALEYSRLLAFCSAVKSAYFFVAILLTSSTYSTIIIGQTYCIDKDIRIGRFLRYEDGLQKKWSYFEDACSTMNHKSLQRSPTETSHGNGKAVFRYFVGSSSHIP